MTMTPEQQRIAIAEACGWTREYADVPTWNNSLNSYQGGYEPVQTLLFRKERKCFIAENLPDYLHDLNAMHEAEKVLTEDQLSDYGAFLKGKDNESVSLYTPEHREIAKVAMASAAQRAEAFLRTIDKWTTNPNEP